VKSNTFTIKEYGVISEGLGASSLNDKSTPIDKLSFESLTNFIEENYENPDFDNAFSIFKKRGKRYIRVKNYVGVVETKQGVVIEILPKTYKSNGLDESSEKESKFLLLQLLKVLKNSPFINLNLAHLKEIDNFPILEIFITTYLDELAILFTKELRGDYSAVEENVKFIKGKLLLSEHIKKNSYKKTLFFCSYDTFTENIAPNRIIKSTLHRLLSTTKLNNNKSRIIKFLDSLENVDFSSNVDIDLNYCKNHQRFLKTYGNLILWSEVYLKNKSFTNFHGGTINQAILFPMEKLFENYIAYLIKRYCNGITIQTQDKKYSLVNQKLNISDLDFKVPKFPLRPDIVINSDKIIIDTKWKLLNSSTRKYDIQEADIYQMHAYGRGYQSGNEEKIPPRLGLVYPKNPDFRDSLLQMRYGKDLLLDVIAFDLSTTSPESEIRKVISTLGA
jgi:5-methylcytosine-specific restriction enzyme subunit McrC